MPALFAGGQRASGVGGTRPPRLSPGGKRERGSSDFLAAAGSLSLHDADGRDATSGVCARFFSTTFSLQITITNIYVDLSISFPEVSSAPPTPLPCFYPHSKWAALGPVHVGVRFQAQVHHHLVMDLGCWVLPSRVRSLKDHSTQRSHPNKAVDVVPTKLFRYLFACERSTYVDSLVFPSSSAWLSPV